MAATLTTAEEARTGRRGELAIFAFYVAAAVVLTWPVAKTLGQATGVRGDYFNNLWNFWWMRHSIAEGHSPWYTEYLYFPQGLSLMRHTLSPLNALAGALLSSFLSLHAAFNTLLILKLAASAWAMSLLARYVTGSRPGAVLAGLVYAFNPFHFYYICQINVFTFEFVPLALLFFARTYREGGRRNQILAVLCSAAIAATTSYYVVYTFLVVGLLIVAGRLLDPAVPWRPAATRTAVVAVIAAVAVVLVSLPLLIGTLEHAAGDPENPVFGDQKRRANDLFGYHWVGGPERVTVSWATMLGYSTLLLLLAHARRLWRQRFWLLVGLAFVVLSLGRTLHVGNKDTGFPLPYALLVELPVLSMLRKPDRCFMVVQLVTALLCAEAWRGLEGRLAGKGARRLAWWGVAALVMVELTGVPFRRFDYHPPAYMEEIARMDDVESVIDLPAMDLDAMNARYSFFQTVHGKKGSLGYSTAFAVEKRHNEQMQVLANGYLWWSGDGHRILPLWIREKGVDLVIHHKTMPQEREPGPFNTRILWAPFLFVRGPLIGMRQTGQYLDEPFLPQYVNGMRVKLAAEFGPPIHEDERVMVFRVADGNPR